MHIAHSSAVREFMAVMGPLPQSQKLTQCADPVPLLPPLPSLPSPSMSQPAPIEMNPQPAATTSSDMDIDDNATDPAEEAESANSKKARTHKKCAECGVKATPAGRRGAAGPKTLCNACGMKWSKRPNKEAASTDEHEVADTAHDQLLVKFMDMGYELEEIHRAIASCKAAGKVLDGKAVENQLVAALIVTETKAGPASPSKSKSKSRPRSLTQTTRSRRRSGPRRKKHDHKAKGRHRKKKQSKATESASSSDCEENDSVPPEEENRR